jgi:hypothetical protein
MANPITTTGTTTDPVSTQRQAGEAVSDWVSRHSTSVLNATPSGNKLSTTWKSAAGDKKKDTVRHSGESDADFLQRHVLEYATAMIENPPL